MTSISVQPGYGLYPHQRQVANDLMRYLALSEPSGAVGALAERRRRVVAHLPTGAGKTRVATHVAAELLNCSPHDDRGLVIWLANTAELCEQAAAELERAWYYLGRWDAAVHRLWGDYDTDISWISGGFLVAGLQKLWAVGRRDRQPLIRLSSIAAGVVFDEAHQAVAPTYESMVEALLWENPPLLGLTATPGRGTILDADDTRLVELFHSNKVSIDPKGHPNAVTFLIEGEYLAFPAFQQVSFETEASDVEGSVDGDYSSAVLEAIGKDQKRFAQVIDLVEQVLRRHNRVMVFCPSVSNAVETGQGLLDRGWSAGVITASTPTEERVEIIERYRNNERPPMALLNYGVLTAGFDAPATSCVVVARPTTSVVLYSQMVGRAMRGRRVGGNRYCDIHTVVDTNIPGFRSVADAFANWEELWS